MSFLIFTQLHLFGLPGDDGITCDGCGRLKTKDADDHTDYYCSGKSYSRSPKFHIVAHTFTLDNIDLDTDFKAPRPIDRCPGWVPDEWVKKCFTEYSLQRMMDATDDLFSPDILQDLSDIRATVDDWYNALEKIDDENRKNFSAFVASLPK